MKVTGHFKERMGTVGALAESGNLQKWEGSVGPLVVHLGLLTSAYQS